LDVPQLTTRDFVEMDIEHRVVVQMHTFVVSNILKYTIELYLNIYITASS